MTVPDLSPAYARLAWAKARSRELREAADRWAAGAMQIDAVPLDDGSIEYVASVPFRPPDELAIRLGEVAYQCRAALDVAVGILRGGATDTSAFVIRPAAFIDRDTGAPRVPPPMAGLPGWALDAVRSMVPEPDTREWRRDLVGSAVLRLDDLARWDRHRRLAVVAEASLIRYVVGGPSHMLRRGRSVVVRVPLGSDAEPHFAAIAYVDEPDLFPPVWRPDQRKVADVADSLVSAAERAMGIIRDADRSAADAPEAG